jgi:hypothetical protein
MIGQYLDDPRYSFKLSYCCVTLDRDLDNVTRRDWSVRVLKGEVCVARLQIWEDLVKNTLEVTAAGVTSMTYSGRTRELLDRVRAESKGGRQKQTSSV